LAGAKKKNIICKRRWYRNTTAEKRGKSVPKNGGLGGTAGRKICEIY